MLKIVDVALFKRSVVIMSGSIRGIRKDASHRCADVRGAVSEMLEIVERKTGESESDPVDGLCGIVKGDVFIYVRKWSWPVFVHELRHATSLITKSVGVDDEEVEACLQEHIYKMAQFKVA